MSTPKTVFVSAGAVLVAALAWLFVKQAEQDDRLDKLRGDLWRLEVHVHKSPLANPKGPPPDTAAPKTAADKD